MLHYTISSRFSLFCYLCVALFYATTASSSVSYVIILYLQCFHCFIICLLRHCTVRGFDCLVFCLLHHHAFSSRFLIIHYLFVTSLLCSGFRLSLPLFCYVGVLSFQGFHCFIICLLRQCCILDFDCLFFCLSRHHAFSLWFLLFHYMFVTSVYYLFKVSIVSLSVCYVTTLF